MPLAIAGMLMVLGPLLAVVIAVAVPVLIGLMAYDAAKSPKGETAERTEEHHLRSKLEATGRRILVERGVARAFVIFGGVFWGVAAFAGLYWFHESGVAASALAAGVPLFASLVTLVIGWYWERVAAIMLTLASAAVIYWGVINAFEAGVWGLVTIALIGPMMTAAVLFWLARREYEAYEALVIRLAQPEFAYATVSNY